MKLNFRKIASVIASAVMIGSTAGAAFAANYPVPFVNNGAADVAVVYGANAASSDLIAVVDLNNDLLGRVSSTTTTTGVSATGGDSVNLATSARKLYYGDAMNAARPALSNSELPTVLSDSKFTDLTGTEYSYTQTVKPGVAAITFGNSNGDLTDPSLYIDGGHDGALTAGHLYNYSVSFAKNLQVNDSTNVQSQKIKLLGVDYIIGASSTNTTLYLYGSGENVVVSGGESKTLAVGTTDHTVELVSTADSTHATIRVDGVQKSVVEGSSYAYPGNINVFVKDIIHPAYSGDLRQAELIIGANTLLLQNGQAAKTGADQTTIKGTLVTINGVSGNYISGFTVAVGMPKTQTDDIQPSESFTDPVFGGLSVQFAGMVPDLNASVRGKVMVSTDDNQYGYVTFTGARAGAAGEQRLTYTYDNSTASTTVQPLLAHGTITSNNRGRIHVLENSTALLNDWIVVNQGDAGAILEVEDMNIDSATAGYVTLCDVISNAGCADTSAWQKITLTNSTSADGGYRRTGVSMFGGTGYTITMNDAGTQVSVLWSSGTTKTLYPRIKLANGGWLALVNQQAISNNTDYILPDGLTTLAITGNAGFVNTTTSEVINGVSWVYVMTGEAAYNVVGVKIDGTTCNFNSTLGPAILFFEPKKWDDSSYGNTLCVPMTTTGATEIAISRTLINGTDSGFVSYNTDTYKSVAVTQYGSFVIDEQRTNQNGVATIMYPSSQMYADVLFTAVGTTVTPGTISGAGGSVMVVKDTEVASGAAKDKNLVVVGGSCINTVARMIVDSAATAPICGADFTAKTNVDAGKYLIKAVASPYNSAKRAVLVAGFEAAQTTDAVARLKQGTDSTDVGTTIVGPTLG